MMKNSQDWGCRFLLAACAMGGAITLTGCFAIAFSANRALAQNITLDGSLGPAEPLTGPNYVIPQAVGRTIGTNLFHSFGQFNLTPAEAAIFQSTGITNILSRVTGGSVSNINGLIQSSSPANIFLINPSGIIFGPNARLEIGGSFVGTTANAIKFGDGVFPATASPVDPNNPVLAVNPSALFFNQTPAGVGVSNQSTLRVPDGQNLFLVGGNVALDGGTLLAPGGRVELGGLAAPGEVKIDNNLRLSFPDGVAQADVSLNNTTINVGSDAGTTSPGNILITGNQLSIVNNSNLTSRSANSSSDYGEIRLKATGGSVAIAGSLLSTTNTASGLAGDIFIDADQVSISDGSNIFSNGRAGRIFITARNQISIVNNSGLSTESNDDNRTTLFSVIKLAAPEGSVLIDQSTLSTTNFGSGYAGDIGISARDQVSLNTSTISSDGHVGRIAIGEFSDPDSDFDIEVFFSPQRVIIANSFLTTNNELSQSGADRPIQSGLISVDARDSISISNNSELQTVTSRTGDAGAVSLQTDSGMISLDNSRIFSTVEAGGRGDGGIIAIKTGSLSVSNRSELQTLVRRGGQGDAGLISIEADRNVSLTNRGRIFSTVEAGATGDAGVIRMDVGSLSVKSSNDPDNASGLTTSMFGVGNPGYIFIQARDDVSLKGNGSGIFSASGSESINLGDQTGGIFIEARSLFVRDGAEVNVDNQGSGLAGDIGIVVREDIILKNQAEINARATSGQGGNIILLPDTFLVLLQNSRISTTSGFEGKGGDGGNIGIINRYIITAPFDDNNINANAFTGAGGNIIIFANRLYDIEKRPDVLTSNDIDPSSAYGPPGQVSTTVLNIDPTQGLSNLPANPVDPTRLIAETCAPRGGITERQKNQFIVTNRGGLPPDPNAAFPGQAVVPDEGTPNQQNDNQPNSPNSTNPASTTPIAIASPQQPENQPDSPGSTHSTSATPKVIASQESNIVEAQSWKYGKNDEIIFTAQVPTVTSNHSVLTPASTCNAFSTQP